MRQCYQNYAMIFFINQEVFEPSAQIILSGLGPAGSNTDDMA